MGNQYVCDPNPLTIIEQVQKAADEYKHQINHDPGMSHLKACWSRNEYFIGTFLNSLQLDVSKAELLTNDSYLDEVEKVDDSAEITEFAEQFSAEQTNEFLTDIQTTRANSAYLINSDIWCEKDTFNHVFVIFKLFDPESIEPKYFVFDGINTHVEKKTTPWLQEINIDDLTTLFETKWDDHSENDFSVIGQKIFQMSEMSSCRGKSGRGKCLTTKSIQVYRIEKKVNYFRARIGDTISSFAIGADRGSIKTIINMSLIAMGTDEIELEIYNKSVLFIQVAVFAMSDVVIEDGVCRATGPDPLQLFGPQHKKPLAITLPQDAHWVICVNWKDPSKDGTFTSYGYAIAKSYRLFKANRVKRYVAEVWSNC